jgi:hypothetical protein
LDTNKNLVVDDNDGRIMLGDDEEVGLDLSHSSADDQPRVGGRELLTRS